MLSYTTVSLSANPPSFRLHLFDHEGRQVHLIEHIKSILKQHMDGHDMHTLSTLVHNSVAVREMFAKYPTDDVEILVLFFQNAWNCCLQVQKHKPEACAFRYFPQMPTNHGMIDGAVCPMDPGIAFIIE